MKHLGDITLIDGSKIEPVDVITFGSPCQDLSIAGKRAGLAGQRSGLFMEAVRIIKQMQEATNGEYPKYAVWENVPGAFSSNKGKDFLAVLEELIRIKEPTISLPEPPKSKWSKAGEVSGSGWSLAWRTMDAQYWGVPQRRLRISLVLDLTGQRAGEILFEPESLRGHFAPSITPGQATAGAVENGAGTANGVYAEVNNVCAFKLGNSEQARSIGYAEELVPITVTVINQCSFINHSLNFMDLLTGFLRQKISKHLFLLKRSTKNIPPRIITLISSKKTCLWTTLSSFCRSITLSEATLNESYFCSKRP